MGDKGKLVKARQELEDLYLGVPDESVNLTFSDFVGVQQNGVAERKITTIGTIHENPSIGMKEGSTLGKSPSIDFVKGMQATTRNHHIIEGGHASPNNSKRNKGLRNPLESSFMYDDVSVMSTISNSTYEERGRRRPGIPHTNICTICSIYIYIFRHRCLVCGRVYCRQCVAIGMGEMTEGRKCIECLGRRFSQRYIQRAGETSCCMRMPSRVKQQELKWAEKGPRGSGDRRYGRSGVVSQSRSPVMPRTPRSPVMPRTPTRAHAVSSPPSFVMSSTFSPTHPLPF